jgi:hypothetical protein
MLSFRVPVLAPLEAVKDGSQRLAARGLVLFEVLRAAGQPGDAPREAGAAFRSEMRQASRR